MKHIKNEFNQVVGLYLYRSKLVEVIHDIPSDSIYMVQGIGDDSLNLKQVRKLRKQLKTVIKVMK